MDCTLGISRTLVSLARAESIPERESDWSSALPSPKELQAKPIACRTGFATGRVQLAFTKCQGTAKGLKSAAPIGGNILDGLLKYMMHEHVGADNQASEAFLPQFLALRGFSVLLSGSLREG